MSSSLCASGHRLLYSSLLLFLLWFGVPYGLVNWKNRASSFSCCLQSIHLHQKRLPYKVILVVTNSFVDVNPDIDIRRLGFVWVNEILRWRFLSLLMRSKESRPALSAIVLGMISRALANIFMTSCSLPDILTACSLSLLESSISVAPPPATTLLVLKHLRTIIIASFRDLSASLMNCSAPPLKMIVADLV